MMNFLAWRKLPAVNYSIKIRGLDENVSIAARVKQVCVWNIKNAGIKLGSIGYRLLALRCGLR